MDKVAFPAEVEQIKNFTSSSNKKEQESIFTELQQVRLRDAKLRFWARIIGGTFLCLLLLLQNLSVLCFVAVAYTQGRMDDLTTVFSIVIPATLVETAAIVHTMVKWIFQDTDYKRTD